MLALIFYITSICSIAASIFLIEKSKEKLNGISWFVLTIITIIGYQGFIGGIVNLVNLPVGIITIGGANWLVSLIFFKIIFENKKIQKYYCFFHPNPPFSVAFHLHKRALSLKYLP